MHPAVVIAHIVADQIRHVIYQRHPKALLDLCSHNGGMLKVAAIL